MDEHYRRSHAKTTDVECRICCKTLLQQNYQTHLKRIHPYEDSNDLRPRDQKTLLSFFGKPSKKSRADTCTQGNQADSTIQSLERNTVIDAEFCHSQESSTLNENDHMECEDKSSEHDQTGQSQLQEVMFDHQEYNKAENLKESDDESLESRKSTRNILAELIKKVDELAVEVRRSKKEDATISAPGRPGDSETISKNEPNDNLTRDLLLQCTSVTEITDKLSEFSFDEERSVMICNVCVTVEQAKQIRPDKSVRGMFSYNPVMDEDPLSNPEFNRDVQSEAFRNLKKHLRRHLTGVLHKSNLDDAASAEKLKSKEERRERLVGTRIGTTCYYLFKKGRPDTDFPNLLLLQSMNELDIGELNHSEKFPARFLPYVAEEVEYRVNNFLNNRLDQTGFRPVGKVVADKSTYKHRTRQFVAFITIVPDSTELIQPIFLDIHVVKAGHTGPAIAKSLIDVLNKKDITTEQYQGGSYDGQYHHLSVPELLDGHFGFTGANRKFSDWDPMHIAGTRDAAIRKESQFSWLVQITEDISSLFKAINWGQEFEHFFL